MATARSQAFCCGVRRTAQVMQVQTAQSARRGRCVTGGAVACALMMALAGPRLAAAGVSFVPSASAGVEYNSNIFAVPSSQPAFAAAGDRTLGDTDERYTVDARGGYTTGEDDIGVTLEGRRYDYHHFTYLSHSEYSADGHLIWHFGPVLTTNFTYSFNRFMAPFANTLTGILVVPGQTKGQLDIDTEKIANALFSIYVSPEWRLDVTPRVHDEQTPLPGYADFAVHEKQATVGLNYLGFGRVTAGVTADYINGDYDHIIAATRYVQRDAGLTAKYNVTGFSSFTGSVGYSVRDSEPNPMGTLLPPAGSTVPVGAAGQVGSTGDVTGSISYDRQLTVKTGYNIKLFREIDSFVAGANAQVGTGVSLGLRWDVDFKVRTSLSYTYEHLTYPGQIFTEAGFDNRVDDTNEVDLALLYQALPWLKVSLTGSYQGRSSNLVVAGVNTADYSETLLQLQLIAQLP